MITFTFRCTWAEGCSESVEIEAPGPTLAAMDAERAGWYLPDRANLVGRWVVAACPEHVAEVAWGHSGAAMLDDQEWLEAMVSRDAVYALECARALEAIGPRLAMKSVDLDPEDCPHPHDVYRLYPALA